MQRKTRTAGRGGDGECGHRGPGLISRLVPSFRQEPGGWGISDSSAPSSVLSLEQEIPRRLRQGLQAGEERNSVRRARGAQRDLGRNEKSKTGVP